MSQISRRVRDAVRSVLSDPASGFNAQLAAIALDYGISPFAIDFGPASRNFFQGSLNPDDLQKTSPSHYPLLMLYGLSSLNRNDTKFCLFSGEVVIAIDVHLSWRTSAAPSSFEDLADAVEDAMIQTISGASWEGIESLAYNGDIGLERLPVEPAAAEHWRQTLRFRLVFEIHTN